MSEQVDGITSDATPDAILAAVIRTTRQISDDWDARFGPDGPALDGPQTVPEALSALGNMLGEAVADIAMVSNMTRKLAEIMAADRGVTL